MFGSNRFASIGAISLAITATGLSRGADEVFPPTVSIGPAKLVRNGFGVCEWGWVGLDLYEAALYLPERTKDAKRIIDLAAEKRIVMRFSRSLSKQQLARAWKAALRANVRDPKPHEAQIERLSSWMVDVEEGDTLTFTWFPEKGLEVRVGDRKVGTIEDGNFGPVFFQLFLGPKPPDENLKRALLDGK
jgi:hypothetical protein